MVTALMSFTTENTHRPCNTLIITRSQVVLGKDKRHTRRSNSNARGRLIHLRAWARPFYGNSNEVEA